jgi:hypothetical protein
MTAHLHVQEMGADGQKANQIGKGHRPRSDSSSAPKREQEKKTFLLFIVIVLYSSFFLHPLPNSSSLPASSPTCHLIRPHKKLSEMTVPKKEGQKKEYYITSDGYDQVASMK